ncbi:hypothetical protein TCAL_16187 [Tigriopus californicus]|uniref:Uncharacterized protein n=1 Tax=Tigriopus californicus TaxID=6832 RepID=A0A553P4T4_TIGCA|nr:hypothetical protein TCAL_16187 [Tigriopus californicus]
MGRIVALSIAERVSEWMVHVGSNITHFPLMKSVTISGLEPSDVKTPMVRYGHQVMCPGSAHLTSLEV